MRMGVCTLGFAPDGARPAVTRRPPPRHPPSRGGREGEDLDEVAARRAYVAARRTPVLAARLGLEAGGAQALERGVVVLGMDRDVALRHDHRVLGVQEVDL